MKKLLVALTIALTAPVANATPSMVRPRPVPTYNNSGYNVGYRHGKNDAYHNVARTLVITGIVIAAGIVIYHAGQESRWTANEKGVVYRF